MAAPDLTRRAVCFVQLVGSDDAGYNAVGAPEARLSIFAALADLAANYPAASATFFHIVAVGPGTFLEPGISLPPWTFINGSCDGESEPSTVVLLSDDVTLSPGWSVNATARGGVSNLTLRAESGAPVVDLTLPVPAAGNPSRTVETWNIRTDIDVVQFEATSTGDTWSARGITHDGTVSDAITQRGGTSDFRGVWSQAPLSISAKVGFPAVGNWQGVETGAGAGITASTAVAAGCTLRLVASFPRLLTLAETGAGAVSVLADVSSIPVLANLVFSGTATTADLTRLNDANGLGYTPAVPVLWPVGTNTVQLALDALAGGGGGGVGGSGTAGTWAGWSAATTLSNAPVRTIGGTNFDGSANVTSFPSPGAIGATTPSTGIFTELTAQQGMRSTGFFVAPSGQGIEFFLVAGEGAIQAYDRTFNVYLPSFYASESHRFFCNGALSFSISSAGILSAGSGPTTLTDATGKILSSALNTVQVGQGGTGATSLSANAVLLGNGTSALQIVTPGASGNLLTSDGTTWNSTAPTAGAGVSNGLLLAFNFTAVNP